MARSTASAHAGMTARPQRRAHVAPRPRCRHHHASYRDRALPRRHPPLPHHDIGPHRRHSGSEPKGARPPRGPSIQRAPSRSRHRPGGTSPPPYCATGLPRHTLLPTLALRARPLTLPGNLTRRVPRPLPPPRHPRYPVSLRTPRHCPPTGLTSVLTPHYSAAVDTEDVNKGVKLSPIAKCNAPRFTHSSGR